MSQTSSSCPQWITVQTDSDNPPWVPFCPVCGQASASIDEYEATVTPCQHLEFVYVSQGGMFEYQSPEFEQAQAQLPELDLEVDFDLNQVDEQLQQLGYGVELIVFEVLSRGGHFNSLYTQLFAFALRFEALD